MAGPQEETPLDRLARFPVERYPVQHATTRFHRGAQLLHAGDAGAALAELAVARDVFARCGLHLEAAKSTVMLGVGLRAAGRPGEATAALTAAGDALAALDQPAEQAAAAYNLGLVRHDAGDRDGAHAAWASALTLFLAARLPGQAAAAARDHGASLLTAGDVDAARPLLEQAAALAERAGDDPGTAAAANVLGLAHLAAGDAAAAVAVLRRALGFSPVTVRPVEHAMVKANLALAHESAGDAARARLAARQALAVPAAAPPVRDQAAQLLRRLPDRPPGDDVVAVLLTEPRAQWVGVVREEVLRLVELPAGPRCAEVRALLDAMLANTDLSVSLVHSLLEVVLELPPRPYALLVEAIAAAAGARPAPDADLLRGVVGSALVRFALPQWQRLAGSLNAAAAAAGQPADWR